MTHLFINTFSDSYQQFQYLFMLMNLCSVKAKMDDDKMIRWYLTVEELETFSSQKQKRENKK